MVRREVRGHVEDRGRQGSIKAFDRAPGPPDVPPCSDYPLDAGIRPASNTCSGDPGEVAEGEVNAHLGNPGSGHYCQTGPNTTLSGSSNAA